MSDGEANEKLNPKYESLNSKQIRNNKSQLTKPTLVWDFDIRICLVFRI